MLLCLEQPERRARLVAWEHVIDRLPQVVADQVAEHVAEVGRHREISLLEELLAFQTRPTAVDLAPRTGPPSTVITLPWP
jgi:hypothetical protein